MIVCFVVFRASGRGGLGGRKDFGPGLMVVIIVGGLGVFVGGLAGADGEVVEFGLLRRWRVTGMKAEVTEAYEIRALLEAWRVGNSSGDEEGGGRVAIGGALVNWTDLGGAGVGVIVLGELAR